MKQVYLLISGYVQDVGFRFWLRATAQKLGIVGWVRNRGDGSVEAECQGKEEALKTLIKMCKTGSQVAEVKNVEVVWKTLNDTFTAFEIRR